MPNPDEIKKSIMNPDAEPSNPVAAINKQAADAGLPPVTTPDKQAGDSGKGSSWLEQVFPEPLSGKYKTPAEVEKALKEKDSSFSKRDEQAKKLEGFFELVGRGDYNTGVDIAQYAVNVYNGLQNDPVGFLKNNPQLAEVLKKALGTGGETVSNEDLTNLMLDPQKAPDAIRNVVKGDIDRLSQENQNLKNLILNFITTQTMSEQLPDFKSYAPEIARYMQMGYKAEDAYYLAKGKSLSKTMDDKLKEKFEEGKNFALKHYNPETGKIQEPPLETTTTPESFEQQLKNEANEIKEAILNPGDDSHTDLKKWMKT